MPLHCGSTTHRDLPPTWRAKVASLRRGAVNRQDLDWSISARSCWITAEIAGLLDTIEIDALDECGKTQRYRLSVFYGRCAAGALRAGSDAAAAQWIAVADLEALTVTEQTAALIRLAALRLGLTCA